MSLTSHGTFQRIRVNKSPTSAEKMPMAKARMACRKGLRVANLGRSQTVMEGYYEALLLLCFMFNLFNYV